MTNMNDYVQELLATLVESIVEMYELPDGVMTEKQGQQMVDIQYNLANLIEEIIESKHDTRV